MMRICILAAAIAVCARVVCAQGILPPAPLPSTAVATLFASAGVYLNFSAASPRIYATWTPAPNFQPHAGIVRLSADSHSFDLGECSRSARAAAPPPVERARAPRAQVQ
jgi:hypothetical protein